MDRLFGQHMSSQTDANAFVVRHPEIHLVPHDYLLHTMSSSKMMLLPAKKIYIRRSPGILLGFFFSLSALFFATDMTAVGLMSDHRGPTEMHIR